MTRWQRQKRFWEGGCCIPLRSLSVESYRAVITKSYEQLARFFDTKR